MIATQKLNILQFIINPMQMQSEMPTISQYFILTNGCLIRKMDPSNSIRAHMFILNSHSFFEKVKMIKGRLLSILVVEGSNPPWHQKFKKTFYKCLNKLKLYNLQINITNSKYRNFIILSISVTNNNYLKKMTKKLVFSRC